MDAATDRSSVNYLDKAHEALGNGAWGLARSWFEEVLKCSENPEALEGLATAAWWQDDSETTFSARERAYRRYLELGDRRGAARVAAFHAIDYCSLRHEPALASGWMQRANRHLDGLDPGPEHAMLVVWEGHIVLTLYRDTMRARELSHRAAAIARDVQAIDWEMLAVALEGLILVLEGDVAQGMRRLDEAATAAVSGEMSDLDAIGTVCCYLIFSCERVRDYDRAAQWCEAMKSVSRSWSYEVFFSQCETNYAGVLMWQGAWPESELVLQDAARKLKTVYPGMEAECTARLAELRRRQGRHEEAALLFERVDRQPLRPFVKKFVLLGRAALALDQGDPIAAGNLAERYLRGIDETEKVEQSAGLELLLRTQIAFGNLDAALSTVRALDKIAEGVPTKPLQGAARSANGLLAAGIGDYNLAQRCFEDAIDLYSESGAPYETALTRLELAGALAQMGNRDASVQEATRALNCFQDLGSATEIVRAQLHLRAIQTSGGEFGEDRSRLTPRQQEILRFVAQGLTNKEIAAELRISVHTVHRHIANILTRLELPSRTAAATFATRHHLV